MDILWDSVHVGVRCVQFTIPVQLFCSGLSWDPQIHNQVLSAVQCFSTTVLLGISQIHALSQRMSWFGWRKCKTKIDRYSPKAWGQSARHPQCVVFSSVGFHSVLSLAAPKSHYSPTPSTTCSSSQRGPSTYFAHPLGINRLLDQGLENFLYYGQ